MQVKFSELTLDTFRMLQALEWEPSGSLFKARTDSSSGTGIGVSDEIPDPSLPPNPHKYILYRPTVQELLLVSVFCLLLVLINMLNESSYAKFMDPYS